MNNFICLAPKNYFILNSKMQTIKKGFKGINLDDDIYINKDDVLTLKSKNNIELFEIYNKNKKNKMKHNILNFIDDIFNNGHSYILSSWLGKIVNASVILSKIKDKEDREKVKDKQLIDNKISYIESKNIKDAVKHARSIIQNYNIKKITVWKLIKCEDII